MRPTLALPLVRINHRRRFCISMLLNRKSKVRGTVRNTDRRLGNRTGMGIVMEVMDMDIGMVVATERRASQRKTTS